MKRNTLLILLILVVGLFNSCTTKNTDTSLQSNEAEEKNWQIWAETLQERMYADIGLDVRAIIQKYADSVMYYTSLKNVQYSLINCNLSREDLTYHGDFILLIQVEHEWGDNKELLYAFIQNEEYQYNQIFNEIHQYIDYQIVDITGNNKQELVMITDDSGNSVVLMPIRILQYQDKMMNEIFNEILMAQPFLPYKDDFSVSFDSKYSFVPTEGKGFNIEFATEIFGTQQFGEGKKKVSQSGHTVFVFDGTKYRPSSKYYDYKSIAQKIYDEKQ